MIAHRYMQGAEAAASRFSKRASSWPEILSLLAGGVGGPVLRGALEQAFPKLMPGLARAGAAPVKAVQSVVRSVAGPEAQLARAISSAPLPAPIPGKPRLM